jgi:prepilin-type N-terminal cleavage/methylation domain-containing protein
MVKPAPPHGPRAERGFTLLEVLVAILLVCVGLLGTVAVQQSVFSATMNANDAAVALRLANQAVEEFNLRVTTSAANDLLAPIASSPAPGTWSTVVYLDANGKASGTRTATARWARQWRVLNRGANLPYNISVQVTYNLDSGNPKIVRVDVERYKTW